MEVLIPFFVLHWYGSLFCQSFFLHRYSAHRVFTLTPFWEDFFHWMTYLLQGASYLNPRAYGIMHNHHHQFSDTENDPHSPYYSKSMREMMLKTADYYQDLVDSTDPKHHEGQIHHRFLDAFAGTWWSRLGWGVLYTLVYVQFAPSWYWYLLLPVHYLMGPIHGAIVNWFGHKVGYRNFNTPDKSVNTLAIDLLLMGELYQNNHHQNGKAPNFAARWWEFDPTYPIMLIMHWIGIIKLKTKAAIDIEELVEQLRSKALWNDLKVKFHDNQKVAQKLWKTQKLEAQNFALTISDMKSFSSKKLDRWARDIANRQTRIEFISAVSIHSSFKYEKLKSWTNSKRAELQQCGFQLLESVANTQRDAQFSHQDWVRFLNMIAQRFANASQEVRLAMQSAYKKIAQRNGELMKAAQKIAAGNAALAVA